MFNTLAVIVDNNSDSDSQVFHVAHLLNEGAFSSQAEEEGRHFTLSQDVVLVLLAAVLVFGNVMDLAHDGLSVRDVTKVSVRGRNHAIYSNPMRQLATKSTFLIYLLTFELAGETLGGDNLQLSEGSG